MRARNRCRRPLIKSLLEGVRRRRPRPQGLTSYHPLPSTSLSRERGSQVDFMAFEEMLDFPPAPKLDLFGKLDPSKATPAEMPGQNEVAFRIICAAAITSSDCVNVLLAVGAAATTLLRSPR